MEPLVLERNRHSYQYEDKFSTNGQLPTPIRNNSGSIKDVLWVIGIT
ncbi:MAG: hypothetical protein IPI00_05205 [Flavobacteriales bacterium]|nr:hypothetical protein [Flavobacteriales bacterium]MBK7239572.1 hypothetical protein [Flavobacteriales bacterium]MBK7296120.1 hypothetical protein [Flavobacteriales bacterium]MBK9535221.1 hypothetical protein [Flavobacteriales bacterium]MBP9137803.1 hypothetical protein [Flavobacteriales bacterium]